MVSRTLVRIGLVCAFSIAIISIIASLRFAGIHSSEAWATVAASLAVITSIFSAWSSQRVLELTEDAQKPNPYLSIDLTSRYELMQLRIVNTGGSPAHDIRISWKVPLQHPNGKVVHFSDIADTPDIPVLLPNESTSKLIGVAREMFQKFQSMNYSGELSFKDSSRRRYKVPFHVSAESYRSSLTYNQEEPRTHHELQKIPGEISKLVREISSLKVVLENLRVEGIQDDSSVDNSLEVD